ncbi:hypothetical protein [Streptomyces sp. NPDC001286]
MPPSIRKLTGRIRAVDEGVFLTPPPDSSTIEHAHLDNAGQLLIFDDRMTQHYAVDNYDDHPRRLDRMTVAGDVPVGVAGRRREQLVGDAAHYSKVLEVAA